MTDSFLAHVRFVDHTQRCDLCVATDLLCETAVQLLAAWQHAEELETKRCEESDRAAHIEAVSDATGYAEDVADDGEFFREAQRKSFE